MDEILSLLFAFGIIAIVMIIGAITENHSINKRKNTKSIDQTIKDFDKKSEKRWASSMDDLKRAGQKFGDD